MSPIDPHEEPWLRDALGSLLVHEPPMAPAAVVDDVRRGAQAVAAAKRRRTVSLALAATVLAVAVPVGLVLRSAPDAAAPPATTQSPTQSPIDASVWTPSDGYVADDQFLPRAAQALPEGLTALGWGTRDSCVFTSVGCAPHGSINVAGRQHGVVTLLLTDITGAVDDHQSSPCPTQAPPRSASFACRADSWRRVGDAWVVGYTDTIDGRRTNGVHVQRGRALLEVVVDGSDVDSMGNEVGKQAVEPLLDPVELARYALSLPLTAPFSVLVDGTSASPAPSSSATVKPSLPPAPAADATLTPDQVTFVESHPCTASDLVVAPSGYDGAGAVIVRWYRFQNRSASSCGLHGFPALRAEGRGAASFTFVYGAAQAPLGPTAVTGPLLLRPGTVVTVQIAGSPCPVGSAGRRFVMDVSVPFDPTLVALPDDLFAECAGGPKAQGNVLSVSPFYVAAG